jgi:hypothetical protein
LIRACGRRGFTTLRKKVSTLKLSELPGRINPCEAREWLRQKTAMTDSLSAAVIGAIAGYLIARHCPEIEWILHTLIG